MARTAKCGICIIGFLLLGLAAYAQQTAGATTVERVDIRGNRRIPEDTIRASIIQTRPGEPFDVVRVEFDLRSLYRTNYFENLEVQEKDGDIGKIVTFIVKEKPLIRSIEYSGNKSFTESDILEVYKEKKLGFTVDSQYDPVKIKMAERVLRDLLLQNGKPLGTVRSEVENIPPYSVRVRFTVDREPTSASVDPLHGAQGLQRQDSQNALSLTKGATYSPFSRGRTSTTGKSWNTTSR